MLSYEATSVVGRVSMRPKRRKRNNKDVLDFEVEVYREVYDLDNDEWRESRQRYRYTFWNEKARNYHKIIKLGDIVHVISDSRARCFRGRDGNLYAQVGGYGKKLFNFSDGEARSEGFMAGYEQTIIVGNVGRDIELKELNSGAIVASFPVAVTTRWTDRQTNEKREKTNWYACSAWGKLAEVAAQFIRKGGQVMIVGTVTARAWVDNDGKERASLDLRADSFQLLGSRDADYGHDEQEVPSNNGGGSASLEDIPFDYE